jgi:hypothetical protein
MDLDRVCENCWHDWRGGPECPVCGYTEPAPEPLAPEGPSMVTCCGWCPNAREMHAAAVAFGRVVTTGICPSCAEAFMLEGRF